MNDLFFKKRNILRSFITRTNICIDEYNLNGGKRRYKVNN